MGIEDLSIQVKNSDDINCLQVLREKKMYASDLHMLDDHGIQVDIDNIKAIPNGRFFVVHKGIKFDCLFNAKDSSSLYVVLNGSKTGVPPEFKRWSWYNNFNGSMLNIADPTYLINKDVGLGWYYGTKEVNYRELTAEIVIKIANFLQIENKNVYFYASSGGCCLFAMCKLFRRLYCNSYKSPNFLMALPLCSNL